MAGSESKDKLTTEAGLRKLVSELEEITSGLCDGSAGNAASFRDIVKNYPSHKVCTLVPPPSDTD